MLIVAFWATSWQFFSNFSQYQEILPNTICMPSFKLIGGGRIYQSAKCPAWLALNSSLFKWTLTASRPHSKTQFADFLMKDKVVRNRSWYHITFIYKLMKYLSICVKATDMSHWAWPFTESSVKWKDAAFKMKFRSTFEQQYSHSNRKWLFRLTESVPERGGGGGYTSIFLIGMLLRVQISNTPKNRMPQNRNPKNWLTKYTYPKNTVLETIFFTILKRYYHLKFSYPKKLLWILTKPEK